MGNDGSHERGPKPIPVAALHVVELPHKVARRTSRKRWHRAESTQIASVANRARRDLAAICCNAAHDQRLALLEAARWHIGDEARSRVAQELGVVGLLRHFDDALADRLNASVFTFEPQEHP